MSPEQFLDAVFRHRAIAIFRGQHQGRAAAAMEAAVGAGFRLLEFTVSTPGVYDLIAEFSRRPGLIVGAGTVLTPADLDASIAAGARFIVSPGLTEPLGRAAIAARVPFLPGISNAGDIMRGLDMGLTRFKFFPAVASGGLPVLKALAAVFGGVKFCPTGGISVATAPDWLAQSFIPCVGGSWIAGRADSDYAAIRDRAGAAAALAS